MPGWLSSAGSGPLMSMLSNATSRSEEHTSELQSRFDLVCRLLLEKKNHDHGVSVDQGAACDCRHLVDGRHALSAAAVRLSLPSRGRIEAVRDLQGDGMAIAEGDHQPCDDRHLAGRALSGLERALVHVRLVSRQTDAGAGPVGCPRLFFTAGEGFRCRPE